MMPTVLRIVIDTVTSGSAREGEDHHQQHRSDVADRRGRLGRMPDPHVLDPKAGNEKVATPEADEWAGEGRDVALGAPVPARTGPNTRPA